MPATYTDRLDGVSTSVAVKAPCRIATTAAVGASGLGAIDGITPVARDRILRKDEADASLHGIWSAQEGAWTRALDFDGERDAVGGTVVFISEGAVNGGTSWRVDGSGPVAIGVDDIAFSRVATLFGDFIDDGLWNASDEIIDDGAWG